MKGNLARALGVQARNGRRMNTWKSVGCSVVSNSATPWTRQARLSMKVSRQEYWLGLPFPSPGDLPHPGIQPGSPALQPDSLLSDPPGKPEWTHSGQKFRRTGLFWYRFWTNVFVPYYLNTAVFPKADLGWETLCQRLNTRIYLLAICWKFFAHVVDITCMNLINCEVR